ncbi:uncharacterized protein LOC135488467 [Lineus longissimus]|uniref:uncharacterized protein LOC135488467 n=1 Tax=Lineus longissimus TaxID=88925 RepID=UPI00315DE9DE
MAKYSLHLAISLVLILTTSAIIGSHASQFCGKDLPRAMFIACGIAKRSAPSIETESIPNIDRLLKGNLRFRRSSEIADAVHSVFNENARSKRGVIPLNVLADVCCKAGCSLRDLAGAC